MSPLRPGLATFACKSAVLDEAGLNNQIGTLCAMKLVTRFLILLVLVLLVAGAVALATWDMPAPLAVREKVISNDRFR